MVRIAAAAGPQETDAIYGRQSCPRRKWGKKEEGGGEERRGALYFLWTWKAPLTRRSKICLPIHLCLIRVRVSLKINLKIQKYNALITPPTGHGSGIGWVG